VKTKIAFLIFFACAALAAQPAFDAASIRTNNDADRPGSPMAQVSPGALTMRNQALVYLIQWAYDVPRVEIEGPPWLREVWFDVQAKTSKPATETELRLMLRKLLEDRFGLKFHKEPRVLPAYALTIAKGGSKLQESTTEGTFSIEPRNGPVEAVGDARPDEHRERLAVAVLLEQDEERRDRDDPQQRQRVRDVQDRQHGRSAAAASMRLRSCPATFGGTRAVTVTVPSR